MKINLDGRKLIVHNLTLRGIEKVPGVLDFDQRGLVFVSPGDTILTKRPPEKSFINYLQSLGWDFTDVNFISPVIINNYNYNSIFKVKTLRKKSIKKNVSFVDCYQVTEEENNFATKLELPLFTNVRLSKKYGTKSGFRKLCKQLNLKVATGFEGVQSSKDALEKIIKLFKTGARAVVVKMDEGLSGAGNTKLKRDFLDQNIKKQKKIVKKALTRVPQAKQNGSVIEKWVDDVVASPSIQILVRPDKKIEVLSMHDQLLEGEEQWYIGCIYPPKSVSESTIDKIKKEAIIFTKFLVKQGYFGYFGLDTVVDKKGKIYWTEANMRKPGTFYPVVIAKKLNNGTLINIYYVACDFTIQTFKGEDFLRLKEIFKKWLYPIRGEKRGIVLYNTGALRDAGRFDVVCLGSSSKDAFKIYVEVKTKIEELKRKLHDRRS